MALTALTTVIWQNGLPKCCSPLKSDMLHYLGDTLFITQQQQQLPEAGQIVNMEVVRSCLSHLTSLPCIDSLWYPHFGDHKFHNLVRSWIYCPEDGNEKIGKVTADSF